MKSRCKRIGMLCLAMAFVLCSLTACTKDAPAVRILEESKEEPEYLSFFSYDSLSGSDIGKYWSDYFARTYNRQVLINYDGAAYYAEEGLSYRELLETRLESSMPDDLYIINAEDVIEFEQKGYWMDLSGMDFVENLSEAALYQSTYDGKVFSVPLTFTGFGFYWNVDMLAEHGLKVPEKLEEFLTVCETLKEAGILPYGANKGYALTVPAMCMGLEELYGSEDREQRIADLNSGKVSISTYMREGFAFLRQMIDKGYLDPRQAMDTVPNEEWEMFFNGECAFICTGLANLQEKAGKAAFETKMTGIPVLPEGAVTVYGADLRLCVNPKSPHLETALEFIEMVGTREALDKSASLEKSLSSAKDSKITVSSNKEKMYELLQSPGQIPNQDFALHFNTWENIRNVGREICGGVSVEEACARLDELQRGELEIYEGN